MAGYQCIVKCFVKRKYSIGEMYQGNDVPPNVFFRAIAGDKKVKSELELIKAALDNSGIEYNKKEDEVPVLKYMLERGGGSAKELTRARLKEILKERGVQYNRNSKTEVLRRLVGGLDE